MFSLLAITAVVCLVLFGGPLYGDAERAYVNHRPELDSPLLLFNWTGAFAKLGSAVFALTCAPAALHTYSAMRERTLRYGWGRDVGTRYVCGFGSGAL